jgi:hypothetical protein
MRDHLLGYAPSAAHAAEHEEVFEEFGCTIGSFQYPYPLGEPTRVADERRDKWAKLATPTDAVYEVVRFEKREHCNPDGSYTTRGMKDAKRGARSKRFTEQSLTDALATVFVKNSTTLADSVTKESALLKKVQSNGPGLIGYGPRIQKVAYDEAMKRANEAEAREQHMRDAARCLAGYGVALPETMNEAPEHFAGSIFVSGPIPVSQYHVLGINHDGPVVCYPQGKQLLGG